MMSYRWEELVARLPMLGDLLVEVRSYRGNDTERFFWGSGGIQDRAWNLVSPLTGDLPAYECSLSVLWHALGAQEETMDDQAERTKALLARSDRALQVIRGHLVRLPLGDLLRVA